MSERPIQRSEAEVREAPVEVISQWLRAGELEDVLGGKDPGRPAGSDQQPAPKPATRADQGARRRSGVEQVTETELRFMTPAQIVAARKSGRLVDLGYAS